MGQLSAGDRAIRYVLSVEYRQIAAVFRCPVNRGQKIALPFRGVLGRGHKYRLTGPIAIRQRVERLITLVEVVMDDGIKA